MKSNKKTTPKHTYI